MDGGGGGGEVEKGKMKRRRGGWGDLRGGRVECMEGGGMLEERVKDGR